MEARSVRHETPKLLLWISTIGKSERKGEPTRDLVTLHASRFHRNKNIHLRILWVDGFATVEFKVGRIFPAELLVFAPDLLPLTDDDVRHFSFGRELPVLTAVELPSDHARRYVRE